MVGRKYEKVAGFDEVILRRYAKLFYAASVSNSNDG